VASETKGWRVVKNGYERWQSKEFAQDIKRKQKRIIGEERERLTGVPLKPFWTPTLWRGRMEGPRHLRLGQSKWPVLIPKEEKALIS